MKKIWVYWNDGWDNPPFVIKMCHDSVIKYASSDFDIIFLDRKNVEHYLGEKLPEFTNYPNFPIQSMTDWLKLKFLSKLGGTWIDSSVFLNAPFIDFYNSIDNDFFIFSRYPGLLVSNWFLISKKPTYIVQKWEQELKYYYETDFIKENEKYFTNWRGNPNYFNSHSTFARLAKEDSLFASEIKKIPFKCATDPLRPWVLYGFNRIAPLEIRSQILSGYPMFKLSYTLEEKDLKKDSSIDLLIRRMRGERIESSSFSVKKIISKLSRYNKEKTSVSHCHLSTSLQPLRVWNSELNKPYSNMFSGIVVSDRDLRITPTVNNVAYHVINSSSIDKKSVTQLLMPFGKDEIYIRHSTNNNFNPAIRLLTERDQENLKHQSYWKTITDPFDKLPGLAPCMEYFSEDYKFYFEKPVPRYVFLKLIKNSSSVFFVIENENCIKTNYSLIEKIANAVDIQPIINSDGYLSIEFKDINILSAYQKAYVKTISIVTILFKY